MRSSISASEYGRLAEMLAAMWLRLRGYRILGRNVRVAGREVDVVAKRGRTLVVCGVAAQAMAGLAVARVDGVFDTAAADRRYALTGDWLRVNTPAAAVVAAIGARLRWQAALTIVSEQSSWITTSRPPGAFRDPVSLSCSHARPLTRWTLANWPPCWLTSGHTSKAAITSLSPSLTRFPRPSRTLRPSERVTRTSLG